MNSLNSKYIFHRITFNDSLKIDKCFFFLINRDEWRFRAVVMRDRFEKNRDVKDLVKAQEILANGEWELEQNRHPLPLQCNISILLYCS